MGLALTISARDVLQEAARARYC
eukprot:COSAG05_NODE_19185_length_296_cov_1.045685_1_plen_22_part_10